MSEMLNKANTNIERIIAKIDNDFNPDNSDWIPRVGAWCIDAMSQLNILRTERKKKKLAVKDRIVYSSCPIDSANIKVYNEHGCEIKKADENPCHCAHPSTGKEARELMAITANTVDLVDTRNPHHINSIAKTINDKYPYRYNVVDVHVDIHNQCEQNYVLIGCDKIELNFDAKCIYVETECVKTETSNVYGCELPVIPNNGLLIEAIAYYCIYKMLCRGYKHPVFNLNASQYGTNPYYIWMTLKEEAKRSVINDGIDIDSTSKLFRSNLFIDTFDPKN